MYTYYLYMYINKIISAGMFLISIWQGEGGGGCKKTTTTI